MKFRQTRFDWLLIAAVLVLRSAEAPRRLRERVDVEEPLLVTNLPVDSCFGCPDVALESRYGARLELGS